MHLSTFEIKGFKSFAEKATMHFTPGITAIVGPNGSGKSNVSDAIRWVLGEQSLKLLRGKRSEDVIFSGSDRKSQLGMAEVTMTLNNEDGKMPVDAPEVAITRRVYRSGEGEYLMNRQPARLQDMLLLFAKAHFGQKSYSVIGQGMIDQTLAATPTERKAFFDEAAGVRQYQIKREQAVRKLDTTRENLAKAALLMEEIAPRLRSLTRQVKRLERREEVEQELHAIQESWYGARYWSIAQEEKALAEKQERGEQALAAARKTLEKTQASLEKEEREKGRTARFDELQREYGKALEEKNALLRESAELKGRLDAKAIAQGDLPLVWLRKRKEELTQELARVRAAGASDAAEKEKRIARRAAARAGRDKTAEGLAAAFAELKELKAALADVEAPDAMHADMEKFLGDHEALLAEFDRAETVERVRALLPEAKRLHVRAGALHDRMKRQTQVDPRALLAVQERVEAAVAERQRHEEELFAVERELAEHESGARRAEEQERGLLAELERTESELKRAKGAEDGDAAATVAQEIEEIEKKLVHADAKLADLRKAIGAFNAEEEEKRSALFEMQKRFRDEQHAMNEATQALNDVRVDLARTTAHREDLERELKSELPEDRAVGVLGLTREPKTVDEASTAETVERLKHQLELIGGIDEGVQEEYSETNERYTELKTQVDDLEEAIGDLEEAIGDLDATIKREFMKSFEKINTEFGKYFKALFHGGRAELVLVKEEARDDADEETDEDEADEEEVMEEEKPKKPGEKIVTGVDIRAVPPGKRVSTINMLSGGERALTSIALLSAIISTNPSPFVFLDEVDAALDEANSRRFAEILGELARKTQFITITHNRATMEMADILYGVTMGPDGVSRLLSVKMQDVDKVIDAQANRR